MPKIEGIVLEPHSRNILQTNQVIERKPACVAPATVLIGRVALLRGERAIIVSVPLLHDQTIVWPAARGLVGELAEGYQVPGHHVILAASLSLSAVLERGKRAPQIAVARHCRAGVRRRLPSSFEWCYRVRILLGAAMADFVLTALAVGYTRSRAARAADVIRDHHISSRPCQHYNRVLDLLDAPDQLAKGAQIFASRTLCPIHHLNQPRPICGTDRHTQRV